MNHGLGYKVGHNQTNEQFFFFFCVLCDSNINLANEQMLQFVIGHSIVEFDWSNEQLIYGKEPVLLALHGWNGCWLISSQYRMVVVCFTWMEWLFALVQSFICMLLILGIAFYNVVFIHKLLYRCRGLKHMRYISYNHVTTIFITHYKKIKLLWRLQKLQLYVT